MTYLRIVLAIMGVVVYQAIQYNYAFDGSRFVETAAILMIVLALIPLS